MSAGWARAQRGRPVLAKRATRLAYRRPQVARLPMPALPAPQFQPGKLRVQYEEGSGWRAPPPHEGRWYTLTHNDLTGELVLSIGRGVNREQISGWYTRLVRDEVLAQVRPDIPSHARWQVRNRASAAAASDPAFHSSLAAVAQRERRSLAAACLLPRFRRRAVARAPRPPRLHFPAGDGVGARRLPLRRPTPALVPRGAQGRPGLRAPAQVRRGHGLGCNGVIDDNSTRCRAR